MQATQIMNTSHSYNQNKIKILCDNLCDDIENLFESLNIQEYRISDKMIATCCPIHGGDNPSAINLYYTGDTYKGNWKCRTHSCEQTFKPSIIGFIRGVLSKHKYNWEKPGDRTVSFKQSMLYATNFLNKSLDSIDICDTDVNKNNFTRIVDNISAKNMSVNNDGLTRKQARKLLQMPCEYFINRGFSREILDRYDVGLCTNPNKEMHQRAVVPIYSYDGKYVVGCTGRSIYTECLSCNLYHDPEINCPSFNTWKYSKWKHNSGFKSQEHLYNFCNAKKYIQESRQIILVESPGNVWRLEEANIKNSVAMFGSSLSDRQKLIIDSSGAMDIIILTDSDEAGEKAKQQIIQKCQRTYRLHSPKISQLDVGDMTIEEIEKQIKPFLREII